jgi:hypothetical protein
LESVVLKAIAKRPGERYGMAVDLAEDLGRFLEGKRPLRPYSSWMRRWRVWKRGRRMTLVGAAAGLLCFLSYSAFMSVQKADSLPVGLSPHGVSARSGVL